MALVNNWGITTESYLSRNLKYITNAHLNIWVNGDDGE